MRTRGAFRKCVTAMCKFARCCTCNGEFIALYYTYLQRRSGRNVVTFGTYSVSKCDGNIVIMIAIYIILTSIRSLRFSAHSWLWCIFSTPETSSNSYSHCSRKLVKWTQNVLLIYLTFINRSCKSPCVKELCAPGHTFIAHFATTLIVFIILIIYVYRSPCSDAYRRNC